MSDLDTAVDAAVEGEPQATPDPQPEPTQAELSSPWAKDLAQEFSDPSLQAQVDQFLRANVQPYVTKLEQDSSVDRNAKRLWDDFHDAPEETFMAVATELYGGDRAEDLARLLSGEEPEDFETAYEDYESLDLDELPSPVQEAVEFYEQEQLSRQWQATLDAVKEDYPDVPIKDELFAPYVSVTGGNVDVAVELYKQHIEELTGYQAPSEGEAPQPPPTITGDQRSANPGPVSEKPASLDEAIDDLFAEMQKPPTTVGPA